MLACFIYFFNVIDLRPMFVVNVAFGKPVSTNNVPNNSPPFLVDGMTDPHNPTPSGPRIYQETCFTVPGRTTVIIDLGKSYQLNEFFLTNPYYPTICK